MPKCQIFERRQIRANLGFCEIVTATLRIMGRGTPLAHKVDSRANIEGNFPLHDSVACPAPFSVMALWTSCTTLKTKEIKPRYLC
jgi:hypothetical protein